MKFVDHLRPTTLHQLYANWNENDKLKATPRAKDFKPVCKLFAPWSGATFLCTELEPGTSRCFGLADTGLGFPELGYFCLEELFALKGPFNLRIVEDRKWVAEKTLAEYADDARRLGYVAA